MNPVISIIALKMDGTSFQIRKCHVYCLIAVEFNKRPPPSPLSPHPLLLLSAQAKDLSPR